MIFSYYIYFFIFGIILCYTKILLEIDILNKNLIKKNNKRKIIFPILKKNNKLLEIELYFQSLIFELKTDQLTGIMNKESFIQDINFLSNEKNYSSRNKFAIIFIDLNGFKKVNDVNGHQVGDEILKIIAKRMQSELREFDLIARFGGDEFVIYLNEMDNFQSAQEIIDRLHLCIEKTINIPDADLINVGASFGIALCPYDGLDLDSLIRTADKRMYEKKFNKKSDLQLN